MPPVQVVGLGMSPADLTHRSQEIIKQAQILVGGTRLLDYFPGHPAEKVILGKDPEASLRPLVPRAAAQQIVVLASGDPNFYGIGPLVVKLFGADQVVIHPNLTAAQVACARLQIPWEKARVVSLHGRSWENLGAALEGERVLIIYTDPAHTPAAVAKFLLARGHPQARFAVLENLGQETERVSNLTVREARDREFAPLNLVVVALDNPAAPPPAGAYPLHLGLPEAAFVHQKGLITKTEVRAVVLSALKLHPGQALWDVGAGCGSVGLEASLLLPGGQIWAVEQDPERAAQISANRERFNVANLKVVCGQAPACLADLPNPQRVFIGGAGRNLVPILDECCQRLQGGGRLVLTAAQLDTLETARRVLSRVGWGINISQISVSRGRPLADGTFLQALNPVWVIAAAPLENIL